MTENHRALHREWHLLWLLWLVSSPGSYVEVLTQYSDVAASAGRAFKEVVKVQEGQIVWSLSNMTGVLIRRAEWPQACAHREVKPCKGRGAWVAQSVKRPTSARSRSRGP